MSNWAKTVAAMSELDLHYLVCKIAGYSDLFTYSWDPILTLCAERDFLKHPRYLTRTQTGAWVVREHQSKAILVRHEKGPIALCQFVAIIAGQPIHILRECQ